MDDVEMAIDAYRVWLETKIEADGNVRHWLSVAFEEALEAFDTIFRAGEEDEEDIADVIEATREYTPGEGISVLETLERMREEGEL